MSMTTEQVKRLRDAANRFDAEGAEPSDGDLMREAADTIEQLAAKVREDNAYQKAFEDIRADIVMYKADSDLSNDDTCRRCGDNVFGSILRIIDAHNPDKVGKEREDKTE